MNLNFYEKFQIRNYTGCDILDRWSLMEVTRKIESIL